MLFLRLLVMKFITLMLLVAGGQSASPKTKMCAEENRIAWRSIKPYVEIKQKTSNHSGIVFDIFRTSLRACCRGKLNFNFTTLFQTQDDVAGIPYHHTVDFILPVQRTLKSTSFQHYPYVPLIESPGLALYVLPDPSGGKMLIHAIQSVTPLVILMFLMVSISGTIFWICESMSLAWLGRTPQTFINGIMSGFWWAFVSMTTVGYGDIVPKTKPSKIFSLAWVLIGVAFCALFTSSITTILTLSLLTREVSLPGMEVGVLKGSEEFKYVLKRQAIPIVFDKISDLLQDARNGKISAALLDAYVAAEFKDKLYSLHLHKIIEHISTNGVIFQNDGFRFASCIRDYILSHQMDIFSMISEQVNTLSIESHGMEVSSTTLIDTKDPNFQIPIFGMLGTLGFFIAIGSLKDWIDKKTIIAEVSEEKMDSEEEMTLLEELSLSQWRKEYKVELGQAVLDIRNDTEKIKQKANVLMERIEDFECIPSSMILTD